jgi:hypothetical protein
MTKWSGIRLAAAALSAGALLENFSIAVVGQGYDKSVLELAGSKKLQVGFLVGGRIQKQFDKIVLAVSKRLQAGGPPPK